MGAYVNVYPITREGFDVEVLGIEDVYDLTECIASIQTALENYFLSREPYIPGYTIGSDNSLIRQTAVSAIVNDITSAYHGIFSGVILSKSGTPLTAYALSKGVKAKLLTMTTT